MIELLHLVLLVIVTEAITELLVAAKITDGLRLFLFQRAFPQNGDEVPSVGPIWWRFINEVFLCGYCMSVWVAFGTAVLSPWWFDYWVVNWFVMAFVLHRLSNWLHVLFSLLRKGRVKTYDIELTHKFTGPIPIDLELHNGSIGQIGSAESPAP